MKIVRRQKWQDGILGEGVIDTVKDVSIAIFIKAMLGEEQTPIK